MATTMPPLSANAPTTTKSLPRPKQASQSTNVNSTERVVSVLGGGALALYGLRKGDLGGIALALLGGAVLQRGVTGHCQVYASLGVSTAEPGASASASNTVDMRATATIRKPAAELYSTWRDAQNLPRFISFLEGVEVLSDTRARWTLNAPLGQEIAFEARIVEDVEGQRIAWRSEEGAMIAHTGEISFRSAPADRGTEVDLRLHFMPPGGRAGAALLSLFDGAAEVKLRADLKRFKQLMETGEIATTDGQSSARA